MVGWQFLLFEADPEADKHDVTSNEVTIIYCNRNDRYNLNPQPKLRPWSGVKGRAVPQKNALYLLQIAF